MKNTRTLEVKSIDAASIFKFFGGIFLLVGLVIGLFGNILRIDIMSTQIIRVFPFVAKLAPGIFTGIAFGIIYGLCAGVVSSIFALLYNFFAALLGGLKFSAKD